MIHFGKETQKDSISNRDEFSAEELEKIERIKKASDSSADLPVVANEFDGIPDHPVLLRIDEMGREALIQFIDGKKYLLRHPGNREVKRWRSGVVQIKGKGEVTIDTTHIADMFFKHCVQPHGHNFYPTLDDILPGHVNAWDEIREEFLEGNLVQRAEVIES